MSILGPAELAAAHAAALTDDEVKTLDALYERINEKLQLDYEPLNAEYAYMIESDYLYYNFTDKLIDAAINNGLTSGWSSVEVAKFATANSTGSRTTHGISVTLQL